MIIGHFDGERNARIAQGPKSQEFHFKARMCAACNGARTQNGDREFDRFQVQVMEKLDKQLDPASALDLPRYVEGSEAYLNVFRYFAKLICCHLAESGGPRSSALAAFAMGETNQNPIFLHISTDPDYARYAEILPAVKFASHGGFVVPINKNNLLPTSFRSSLSLGPARYIFYVRLGIFVGLAIRIFHRSFWHKCVVAYRQELENPLSNEQRNRLGL